MPELRTEHYDPDRAGSFGDPTWADTQRRRDTFLDFIRSLPDEVERCRDRGLPVTFSEAELPADPEAREATRELLETLGVELVPVAPSDPPG